MTNITTTSKLTVKEAAKAACVGPMTIRAWLKTGLTHYRLGARGDGKSGKILIDEADLKAFVDRCRVSDSPQPKAARRAAIKTVHVH